MKYITHIIFHNEYYPFTSYRRFLMPLQQNAFWKHSDKRRNCTKSAISPFATMFPLLVIGYPFNYRDFLFFFYKLHVQRHRLQNYRMREMVTYSLILTNTTLECFLQNLAKQNYIIKPRCFSKSSELLSGSFLHQHFPPMQQKTILTYYE